MITPSLVCIAVAVYFEARGEPSAGQIAVAQVIQNRIEDPRYPDNACAVVKQGYYWNGNPIRNKCQFSFYCDGKSDNPRNTQSWYNALYIAHLSKSVPDTTEGATHYHSTKVFPEWAYTGEITTTINKHIFYTGVN
jgi:spore germination cell wall hydrolase CwlJ-like protein